MWIELLKNAYYTEETKFKELEILPNIDINIKCGNSLISRFALDADLSKALKSIKYNINQYKGFVHDYKNAHDKELKRGLEQIINSIKNDFRVEISSNSKEIKDLNKWKGELINLTMQTDLFEKTPKEKKEFDLEVKKLTEKISKQEALIEDIKTNAIYRNAFEWRFEFPEVLDKDGNFEGFDAVIGNPPYLRVRDVSEAFKNYYSENYVVSENQLDLYHLFIEKSHKLLKQNAYTSFIVPNAFLANQNNQKLRKFILDQYSIKRIIEVKDEVFEEASVEVLIYLFQKNKHIQQTNSEFLTARNGDFCLTNLFDQNAFYDTQNNNFTVTVDEVRNHLIKKIRNDSCSLSDLFDTISGIKEYQVGKGKPPQTEAQVKGKVFNANSKINDTYLPELRGRNLNKYSFEWTNEFISYGNWIAEPRLPKFFEGDKILVRQIPSPTSLIASFVGETFVVDQTAYIAKAKLDKEIDLFFYLGILNSKVLHWYFKNINNEFDNLFPKIKVKEFNALPLPLKSNKIISVKVKEIINIKSKNIKQDTLQLENEIDQLIYKLYDLTEDEIKIVGGQ